jgi:hypothetical protein
MIPWVSTSESEQEGRLCYIAGRCLISRRQLLCMKYGIGSGRNDLGSSHIAPLLLPCTKDEVLQFSMLMSSRLTSPSLLSCTNASGRTWICTMCTCTVSSNELNCSVEASFPFTSQGVDRYY